MNNTFPLRHPEEIRFTQVGVGQPGWTSLGVQTSPSVEPSLQTVVLCSTAAEKSLLILGELKLIL